MEAAEHGQCESQCVCSHAGARCLLHALLLLAEQLCPCHSRATTGGALSGPRNLGRTVTGLPVRGAALGGCDGIEWSVRRWMVVVVVVVEEGERGGERERSPLCCSGKRVREGPWDDGSAGQLWPTDCRVMHGEPIRQKLGGCVGRTASRLAQGGLLCAPPPKIPLPLRRNPTTPRHDCGGRGGLGRHCE